ncbi:hypothetical protein KXJ72_17820 (plasmid) [Comamonas aquatica]|nr:hypothetical protein KXJ72_17820 [Comamonas aquatica]
MSLDLFACHAVHQAVLQGDVDAEAGFVLSILPKNIQESSLNQLKQLPSIATASQLVNALEFKG